MISSLTMDQLRVLVEISERGSFSAAARALGRVQSAISQSVKSLEETQGVQLFERQAGKVPIEGADFTQSFHDQQRGQLGYP